MLLARHIVSKQAAPGLTPKKRRPAPDGMDGQIRNPGDGGTPPDPKDDDAHKRQSRNLNAQKSSTSLESSATSSGSEAESGSRGSPVVELMPDVLGHRPAFDSPIAAFYAWRWIATDLMEVAIPASYWPSFFTAAVARRPTGGAGPASPLRARGRSRTSTGQAPCFCGLSSGQGCAPRIPPYRRRDCHLRRRAPAARGAGPAPPLRARGRSSTSTGPAPCSCGLSSGQGQCAQFAGGLTSSAGPASCPCDPSSGQGVAP